MSSRVSHILISIYFFFFNHPPPTEIYTLSLHDALPISPADRRVGAAHDLGDLLAGEALDVPQRQHRLVLRRQARSEEHTSELQSRQYLVCRLLLEKKKKTQTKNKKTKHQNKKTNNTTSI